jgi:hypothetical protein
MLTDINLHVTKLSGAPGRYNWVLLILKKPEGPHITEHNSYTFINGCFSVDK